MQSRARLLGHPIHQILIVFPLGLLATSVVFDLINLIKDNGYWSEIGYWMMAAGVIGGVLSAPFGLLDWMKIPEGTRAKTVGLLHGAGNLIVLILFAVSWYLRRDEPRAPSSIALILSFAGAGLAGVTGWLGGELVNRLGVGVDDGAHLDAPSSLSGRSAREDVRQAPRVT